MGQRQAQRWVKAFMFVTENIKQHVFDRDVLEDGSGEKVSLGAKGNTTGS